MTDRTEITISAIVHATEDAGRLYESFEEMLGVARDAFDVRETAGHFENPITTLNARVSGRAAEEVAGKISSGIPAYQKREVAESLGTRMDGSALYLRLDKQEFVRGRMALDEKSAIRIRIHVPAYTKKDVARAYEDLLGLN